MFNISLSGFMILLAVVVLLVLACVIVGGWLVWKCKAAPGERFIGPEPKGSVFTIPEAAAAPDFVDGEQDKRMLERTEQFMEKLMGGKG